MPLPQDETDLRQIPDPPADAEVAVDPAMQELITRDQAYQELQDDRRMILDEHKIRLSWWRARSDRRRANAEVLGAMSALVKPSPLEVGFSSSPSVGETVEEQLDRSLIAVLREVEADSLAVLAGEIEEDDDSSAEGE